MKRDTVIRIGLWLAFGATLVAAWFAPENDELILSERSKNSEKFPVVAAGTTLEKGVGQKKDAAAKVLRIKKRKAQDDEAVSLFALPDWQQQPKSARMSEAEQEAMEKTPPPPPTAPPLPFKVMGRFIEDGKITVFLLHSERTLIAREGEILASSYKVERIDDDAVHLRYLPLDIPQVLETGSAL